VTTLYTATRLQYTVSHASSSFKLAVHVLGDSFAHLQEHFDCIYSFLEQCTNSAADSSVGTLFQKAVYTVKVLLRMDETVARNIYSKLKRINRTNFAASFWFLISLYWTVYFNRWCMGTRHLLLKYLIRHCNMTTFLHLIHHPTYALCDTLFMTSIISYIFWHHDVILRESL